MSGRLRRRALVVAILMLLSVVSGEAAIAFWRAPGTRSGAGAVTTGILNYWRLGDATTLADEIEPPHKNGTWVNGPVPGAVGAIAGDTTTAVTFDGDDNGQAARWIAGSFSIGFWFRSTHGSSTSTRMARSRRPVPAAPAPST